jgi:alkylation response protein AidB-like acyl-CoA dehydrogenase
VDEAANAANGTARREAELGLLTPVAKSWPAEFGLAANDLAIQIHGGYGYTRNFDVERSIATKGSIPSMKAPTAFRRSTWSEGKSCATAAPLWGC